MALNNLIAPPDQLAQLDNELEDVEIQLMGLEQAQKHTPNQDGTSSITLQQS